jgi:CheY-like chemotaxis protein/anti-sigma regulatory factor (Ser/Thr protein kinase)
MLMGEMLKQLNVLVVDDNSVNRRTMELVLEQLVGKVYTAIDGEEGLSIFKRKDIDIIFTDHEMPRMTGLELANEVLKIKPETPIILVTGHNESDVVINALNSGITHFLAKPITRQTINRALENSYQKVLLKTLENETRKKDLELLRFKARYHSQQENTAFKKQLNLIRNEHHGMFLENNGTHYFVNTFYKPLDTLSGDGYSIRQLADGSSLIFLIDSMGKGISASVTTFISIAYINHIIDNINETNNINLTSVIDSYLNYIRKVLLDEEIVSCAFLWLNSDMTKAEYSLFSVPALYIKMPNELMKIKSNNPPLISSTDEFKIGTADISGVESVALFTDGLLENSYMSKPENMEMLIELIKSNPPFMHMQTFLQNTVTSYEDDISFVYINSYKGINIKEFNIKPTLKDVMIYINETETILRQDGLCDDEAALLTGALTELVMNAFEHGCLEIELEEKTRLITEGTYDDRLKNSPVPHGREIKVTTEVENRNGSLVFCAEVSDNGKGFDFRKKRNATKKSFFGGNGIKMVTSSVDEIYFNSKGNKVRIYKTIKGECSWK